MRRRNGAGKGLQARQSVSTFAKCLLVSVLPKPLPLRMVSHAAARFCETLPLSPDSPVRNALLLQRFGVQSSVKVFLHERKKVHFIPILFEIGVFYLNNPWAL